MQPQKKNPFDVSLCRFLYVVGIQSVRILKRINRRIARFFRPAVCSAVALCRRVAGPHVAALKAEGARVGERFQIARSASIVRGKRGRYRQPENSFWSLTTETAWSHCTRTQAPFMSLQGKRWPKARPSLRSAIPEIPQGRICTLRCMSVEPQ